MKYEMMPNSSKNLYYYHHASLQCSNAHKNQVLPVDILNRSKQKEKGQEKQVIQVATTSNAGKLLM